MITLSAAAASVLSGRSYQAHLAVESWYGGELLADAIPVADATEETDRALAVPERLTLTVPRRAAGYSWAPDSATHPLAANGQRLRVQLGIGLGGSQVEWFQRGWFLIRNTSTAGDSVTVEAVGLLELVAEARLVSPYQPTGTLVSTLRGLVEPALTVAVDGSLSDRAVPSGVNYAEDRLSAVNELLDAWPADSYVSQEGYLVCTAPAVPAVSRSITDGDRGTAVRVTGSSTREGGYSAVVARGTTSAGVEIQATAYDYTGPKAITGPFNPLPVPYFYPSPLLTTLAQCQAAAATVLARLQRNAVLEFSVEMVPDPRLQVGDVIALTHGAWTDLPCSLETSSLPYLGGGPQRLTVRALP